MGRLQRPEPPDSKKGQNLIEFTLVAPILLLLLFGIIDLGRAFYANMMLENAARVAARYVASYPADSRVVATAQALAEQEATEYGVVQSVVVVVNTPPPGGTDVSATATGTFSFFIPELLGISSDVTMSGNATIRVLVGP